MRGAILTCHHAQRDSTDSMHADTSETDEQGRAGFSPDIEIGADDCGLARKPGRGIWRRRCSTALRRE